MCEDPIINAKETIALKYGLLILYVFTFLAQGCLLIGAPFSSLHIFKGSAVRYMLPLVLCSFPLFFSFVIAKEPHTGIRDYPAWITALVLLLISAYLNWKISYYRMGLIQYPSFLWICLTAVPFIAWALYYHGFHQIKGIFLVPSALVLFTIFYGDILEKSYQALMKSKIGFHRDAARYILHGKTDDIYKEILLEVYKLKKRHKWSSQTDRFFLLSRLDFPVNLLGPVYNDRVWDIHNDLLRKGAKRVGFRFEPDKYCEFLIAVQNTTASEQQKGKDVNLIKDQVADFLPGDAYILKAFSIRNTLLYQVLSKQPQAR